MMNTMLEVQDEYRKIAESVRTALLDLEALEEERRKQAEGGKVLNQNIQFTNFNRERERKLSM